MQLFSYKYVTTSELFPFAEIVRLTEREQILFKKAKIVVFDLDLNKVVLLSCWDIYIQSKGWNCLFMSKNSLKRASKSKKCLVCNLMTLVQGVLE